VSLHGIDTGPLAFWRPLYPFWGLGSNGPAALSFCFVKFRTPACGPTVRDLRQSIVRWLAQFASYCEARDCPEVASTGLLEVASTGLLVLAIKSAPKEW